MRPAGFQFPRPGQGRIHQYACTVLGIMGKLKHYIGFKRGSGNLCKGPGNVKH